MSRRDGKRAGAHAVARHAVVLDLAGVEAACGLARGVAVHDRGRDVVRVDARAGNGVGDDEAALRVAAERDLAVRAVGLGLRDQLGHHGAALAAHVGVAGDRGLVVDALDRDAVGAEGVCEGAGDGRADGGAHVLLCLLALCVGRLGGVWRAYARLSGATREDEGDGSAFAVDDVVAGAATTAATEATEATELALLDRRSQGDGSCVKQVRESCGVLHDGGLIGQSVF